jgi:ribosomal protein S12 methylthiotransferase
MPKKIAFIGLGCPKNQVNAERMLAQLQATGMELVENIYSEGADAAVINTCCFIDDAKREAIESILEMVELKREGLVGRVIVTGCMAQSYGKEIWKEIPEVDAVLGLGANGDVARHVLDVLGGKRVDACPGLECLPLGGPRTLTSPAHWAYLQLADGCSNRCSYCKIPDIRGPYRSRTLEDILEEAEQLVAGGVKELVLIAQDTTRYGRDIYGKRCLPALLRALCLINGLQWIRLLYCYPDEVDDELIQVLAEEDKIVKYIDLPLQHIDDQILRAMGRRGSAQQIRLLLEKLRAYVPDIAIRTTFITGFPGEEEDAFEALSAFVAEQKFEHMGVFSFSPQEGTPAYDMPNQVDGETSRRRADTLTQQQAEIVAQRKQGYIGKILQVIVEGYDGYSDSYTGRTPLDAPEIDGGVVFVSRQNLEDGDIVSVKLRGVREDDLLGEAI